MPPFDGLSRRFAVSISPSSTPTSCSSPAESKQYTPKQWSLISRATRRRLRIHATLLSCLALACVFSACNITKGVGFWDLAAAALRRRVSSDFGPRPRMVQLQKNDKSVTRLALPVNQSHWIQDRRNHYWIDHGTSNYGRIKPRWHDCEPMDDWQDEHYPTCLDFHEIDLEESRVELVGSGGFRDAWMVREYNGTKRALKTLLYEHDFYPRMAERHRVDAAVMSKLSSSPYIADIYGYCGNSALVDFSQGHGLSRIFKHTAPSKNDLLRIAGDVAVALADAHLFDSEGRATLVHRDIKPNQWIWLDKRYKLNDFNLAKPLLWNTKKNRYCDWASGYDSRWQAPEQMGNEWVRLSEKGDIYSLGSVFYFLLTGKKPYNGHEYEEASARIVAGRLPKTSNKKFVNSTHPFDVSVRKAMWQCWEHDPDKRPTSRQVADMLQDAVSKLEAK